MSDLQHLHFFQKTRGQKPLFRFFPDISGQQHLKFSVLRHQHQRPFIPVLWHGIFFRPQTGKRKILTVETVTGSHIQNRNPRFLESRFHLFTGFIFHCKLWEHCMADPKTSAVFTYLCQFLQSVDMILIHVRDEHIIQRPHTRPLKKRQNPVVSHPFYIGTSAVIQAGRSIGRL